jgi:hypothetical protein
VPPTSGVAPFGVIPAIAVDERRRGHAARVVAAEDREASAIGVAEAGDGLRERGAHEIELRGAGRRPHGARVAGGRVRGRRAVHAAAAVDDEEHGDLRAAPLEHRRGTHGVTELAGERAAVLERSEAAVERRVEAAVGHGARGFAAAAGAAAEHDAGEDEEYRGAGRCTHRPTFLDPPLLGKDFVC